jgi:hypothetical protein
MKEGQKDLRMVRVHMVIPPQLLADPSVNAQLFFKLAPETGRTVLTVYGLTARKFPLEPVPVTCSALADEDSSFIGEHSGGNSKDFRQDLPCRSMPLVAQNFFDPSTFFEAISSA